MPRENFPVCIIRATRSFQNPNDLPPPMNQQPRARFARPKLPKLVSQSDIIQRS